MGTSPYFWTDIEQATRKLVGCVLMYEDDPVYIERVNLPASVGGPPIAVVKFCNKPSTNVTLPLDDPKFHKFRKMPSLGWCNPSPKLGFGYGAIHLERITRNMQPHGLRAENVAAVSFNPDMDAPLPSPYTFDALFFDKGFVDSTKMKFPTLQGILENIKIKSALAYSPKYAVYRDSMGLRWLYRRTEKIGLFTGTDTLNLFTAFAFYREELMEDPFFTLNTIQEF
jgi:hypothetical protein